MPKYTIEDVAHIIDPVQTGSVIAGVEAYLNDGTIPEFDPCFSCEPNHIRKLIAQIQAAETQGLWPPKKADADVAIEGGYVAGNISKEELDAHKAKTSTKGKK